MKRLAIGVDLGGTNARAAVIDRDAGTIVSAHKEPHRDRSPDAVVGVVVRAIEEAARAEGHDARTFGQVGVGVAGQCLGRTGVVLNAPNLGWRDVPFGDLLERASGLRVRIANDLSAAAWGERTYGAARGIGDALLVFVGSGVGSGLILGGRLHEGSRGVAGELGHVKVRPSRATTRVRRCGCGEMGCLEAYTSGMNIAARVREELSAGATSAIGDLVQGDPSRINATVIDAAHRQGDAYAVALWDEVSDLLGNAVASAITLLNPACVILGGGVILGCPDLRELVEQRIRQQVTRSASIGFTLERAFLGDDAGVIGAALLE